MNIELQQDLQEEEGEEGFLIAGASRIEGVIQDIDVVTDKLEKAAIAEIPKMDDIPDLDDDDLEGFGTVDQTADPASLSQDKILKTR
jgi:hypothetical protein